LSDSGFKLEALQQSGLKLADRQSRAGHQPVAGVPSGRRAGD